MEEILSRVKNIYLVGIGGVGMSGLALLLKERGFNISGSDSQESVYTKILKEKGIKVSIGHKREHITSDIHILAYSSAVKDDNVEILEAKKKTIPILKRGELLAELSRNKKTIAIAGSHGKTTTTSLLSYLLTSLGYKPAVFLGGLPLNYSLGAWWGEDYFVIETDESDGSFLYYNPWTSIITNIDYEHLDYHKTIEKLRLSFLKFASQTKDKVFGWGDQPFVSEIINKVGGISFGWGEENLVRAVNLKFKENFSYFDLLLEGKFITSVKTPLLGEHNCLNTLAAFAFFSYLGEDLEKVTQLLENFKGTKRRFQIKEKVCGVTFIDDYAHHPTEIKAVLDAAYLLKPKRIFVIFQPHRFSRVKLLFGEFLKCFSQAHKIVVTDIYSAHEKDIEGISSLKLSQEMNKINPKKAEYIPAEQLSERIPSYLKEGDLVLALGAGNINILMEKVIDEFKKNRA